MLNPFVMKKWAALILSGAVPTILWTVGSLYYGLWGGVGFFLVGLLLSVIAGSVLLSNPFTKMLEGKGVLGLLLDSTGIIKPFIWVVKSPYMFTRLGGKNVKDVFNREAVGHIAAPQNAELPAEFGEKGGLNLRLTEKELNDSRFQMFHFPCVIFNNQIGSTITKDWLSDKESTTFAEHGILYMNRQLESLNAAMLNFGRYIVELTKPSEKWYQNKWILFLVIGLAVLLLVMFAPAVINAVKGMMAPASTALQTAGTATGGAVTPIQ